MTIEPAVASERGFSLIELIVAIVILALLLAAGLPSAATWIRNTRIRTAAETLQNGLRLARNEAVRRNTRVGLWLVSLDDPKLMDDSCKASSSSASWVVNGAALGSAVASPAGKCSSAASRTVSPFIVKTHAAGDGAGSLSLAAVQSNGTTAATSIVFDGFGQVVGGGIAKVSIDSATGSGYRSLRIDISTSGQIRMCDPNLSSTTDPQACPAAAVSGGGA